MLYRIVWAKATKELGYAPDEDDPTAKIVHKLLQARERRRVKAAIQATRIKGVVRCTKCANPGRVRENSRNVV